MVLVEVLREAALSSPVVTKAAVLEAAMEIKMVAIGLVMVPQQCTGEFCPLDTSCDKRLHTLCRGHGPCFKPFFISHVRQI